MRRVSESIPPGLIRPLRAVARRIRLQRSLDAAALFGIAGLGLGAAALAAYRAGVLGWHDALPWLLAAACLPVAGAVIGAIRPVARLLPAQLLDRSHGLRSRIASALELAVLPPGARSAFADAAVRDAEEHGLGLVARRALPFRRPPGLAPLSALGIGVACLAIMVPPPRAVQPPAAERLAPLLLHPDDLQAFRAGLDQMLAKHPNDPALREITREYNQLLEDLADRRLDRIEALRRISELERGLLGGRVGSDQSLEDSLRRLGDRIGGAGPLEDAARALRDANAAKAEQKLEQLSERLRKNDVSKADLAQLRRDLERAAQPDAKDEQLRRDLEKREQEQRRLLQRQQRQPNPTPEQQRLLRQRKRELEQLRREQQQMQEQQRQLEQLRRDLQQAAQDLQSGAGPQQAGSSLDRGAQDLNRMARQQMTEEQMRSLEQQLRQLRELIRRQREAQQGQGGQGQGTQPMDRFVLRAEGKGGQSMPVFVQGPQGQGGQGGSQGNGRQGQGQGGPGEGQGAGQGRGQGGRKALVIGGNGPKNAELDLPGMGQLGAGQGQGDQQGPAGPGIGTSHDPHELDNPTHLRAQHDDTQVQGQEAGNGPSRSEVILGAADRGFVSRGYEKVYTDYMDHAEQVLEKDQVPPGYRFYVRRYFQLIRPREGK